MIDSGGGGEGVEEPAHRADADRHGADRLGRCGAVPWRSVQWSSKAGKRWVTKTIAACR